MGFSKTRKDTFVCADYRISLEETVGRDTSMIGGRPTLRVKAGLRTLLFSSFPPSPFSLLLAHPTNNYPSSAMEGPVRKNPRKTKAERKARDAAARASNGPLPIPTTSPPPSTSTSSSTEPSLPTPSSSSSIPNQTHQTSSHQTSPSQVDPNVVPPVDYSEAHSLDPGSLQDRIDISMSCSNTGKPSISKFSKEELDELDNVTMWMSSGDGGFERLPKGLYTPKEGEYVQNIRIERKAAHYKELDRSRKEVTQYDIEQEKDKRVSTFTDNVAQFINLKSLIHEQRRHNPIILTPHKREEGEDWKLGFDDGKEREMWRYSVIRDEDGVLLLIVYWQTEEERQDPQKDAGLIAGHVFKGSIDPKSKDDFIAEEKEKEKELTFRPLDLMLNFFLGLNRSGKAKWKGADALIQHVQSQSSEEKGKKKKKKKDRDYGELDEFLSDVQKAVVRHNYCIQFNKIKRAGTQPVFTTSSCPKGFEGLIAEFDASTNWAFVRSRDMKHCYKAHHFKKDGGCQRTNPRKKPMYSQLMAENWRPHMRVLTR